MHRLRRLVIPAVLALAVAACSGPSPGAAATVNGTDIAAERLETRVVATVDAAGEAVSDLSTEDRSQQIADVQRSVLTDLIYLELIDQKASDEDVTATEAEIDELFAQTAEQAGGEEQLTQQLEAAGLTQDTLRQQLAAQVKFDKLRAEVTEGLEVTEQEVREAFQQQQAQAEPAEVSHILVETEEAANQVLADLEGGASFAELATERSQDPGSAEQGGSLGTVDLGQLAAPFAEAVRGAEVGDIVGPVQTEFGWHVIRVDGRPETTFEEAAPQIRAQLEQAAEQQAVNELLTELVGGADVTVDSRFGEWSTEQGAVVAEEGIPSGDGGDLPAEGVVPGGGAG